MVYRTFYTVMIYSLFYCIPIPNMLNMHVFIPNAQCSGYPYVLSSLLPAAFDWKWTSSSSVVICIEREAANTIITC